MKRSVLAVIIVVVVVAAILAVSLPTLMRPTGEEVITTPRQTPEEKVIKLVIHGGEIDPSKYGYAFKSEELQSPGPVIKLKVGETVEITFINEGKLPHTLAATSEKRFDAPPLWGLSIGSAVEPIGPGGSFTLKFTPTEPGEYYYVCQVPGHIELGMWGRLVVE